MGKIEFLNTMIDNITMEEAINKIDELIQKKKSTYIVTPNVDHIVRLEKDVEFKDAYNNAELVLADGMPLIWISKYLGTPIVEKISGSDLLPKVCEMASKKSYKVFFLGAAPGVAEKAAKNLQNKFDGLNICGYYSPKLGFENDEIEILNIIEKINNCNPDILALALGTPKQEKFIYKYKDKVNAKVTLNIGAAIDFEAGKVKRAPKWMQNFGLEWFYRLCKEPERLFKRYLIDDMKIIKIVFKYRKKNKFWEKIH